MILSLPFTTPSLPETFFSFNPMTSYASYTSPRADIGELRRLRSLLPPELQSWVTVEPATDVAPPLITCEELGRDQVEVQIDLTKWEQLAIDQRNLLFWHEVARVQSDTIPRDGWEMAALAIGLGGAVGELWVQDGLLLLLAMGLCGVSGWRLYKRNNGQKKRCKKQFPPMKKQFLLLLALAILCPTLTKSLGSALKTLIEQTPKKKQRDRYIRRLEALKKKRQSSQAAGRHWWQSSPSRGAQSSSVLLVSYEYLTHCN